MSFRGVKLSWHCKATEWPWTGGALGKVWLCRDGGVVAESAGKGSFSAQE